MNFEYWLALIILLLTFVAFFKRTKRRDRYPPGPRGLPLIGNLLQLRHHPHLILTNWAKKYGPIFSVRLGLESAIVVSDHKMIKEVFGTNAGSGRSQNPIFLATAGGNYGVANSEGPIWEEQRRFTMRRLRDLGFAKSGMEARIVEEVNSFLEWLGKHSRKSIPGHDIFNGVVVNALWNIVASERNDWDDDKKPPILEHVEKFVSSFNRTTSTGLIFAPFLRHVAPDLFGWTELQENVTMIDNVIQEAVARHAEVVNAHEPIDLIDHYLNEMGKTTNAKSGFYKETGEKNLKALIVELFLAGNETTSTTLSWMLLYLSRHPEMQFKLQQELDTVLGHQHQPSITDKSRLPYSEAIILETLRLSSILPLGILHRALEDIHFHGFLIPKGTTIIANLYKVHQNPEIWTEPDKFQPERFLNSDGTKVIPHEALIPFCEGKRKCLGASLAKDSLFLFVTSIFQKYTIIPDPMWKDVDFEPVKGFLLQPKPFRILVEPRDVQDDIIN